MAETLYGPASPRMFSREEHALKELGLQRETARTPRRSQTTFEYQIPFLLPSEGTMNVQYTTRSGQDRGEIAARGGLPSPISEAPLEIVTESSGLASPSRDPDCLSMTSSTSDDRSSNSSSGPVQDATAAAADCPRRPALPKPRRSYSVMDYEPLPHTHRPSSMMALMDLPREIHYAIFAFLDRIDGTCLGLTNNYFYAMHRHLHGSIPLSVRREGPNDMEWAWRQSGNVMRVSHHPPPASPNSDSPTSPTTGAVMVVDKKDAERHSLSTLRVRGHAYCRTCGIQRCELHRHIEGWMGPGYEYCSVRRKFGTPASEGAPTKCYLKSPIKPERCGRHRVAKSAAAASSAGASAVTAAAPTSEA